MAVYSMVAALVVEAVVVDHLEDQRQRQVVEVMVVV